MMINYSLQDVNFAVPTIYNGQQNIYKKYSSILYLYTKAEILIDWGVASSSSEYYVCKLWYTDRKKIKSFWHKKLSHLRN